MVECPLDNFPALKRFLMGVKINKMLDLLRLFSIQICQLRIIKPFPQRFMMNGSMERTIEWMLLRLIGVFVGEVINSGDAHDASEHDCEYVFEEQIDCVAELVRSTAVTMLSHDYNPSGRCVDL